ncbi:DUF362 domain-containing protein [Desulforhopalus singaporensis]|uniref:Dissimilatory sulfite reductase (Desulfoviridin), alpha and beta subunits n=1 Tax=Desulforhopalus singaporensis TaxID=91360 RepID=A0A1H0N6J9_9BACT|nr:4Fe-4S dicluster domain-containing protein [Desulforhopalus singaporensis]SDO88251.1 Dissimilatory sulfite reductase (desulfoviridin), alpha and beta subunits [Desulforhopalus singaporensis]
MKVNTEVCVGCGFCVLDCPTGAVSLKKKKAVIESVKCTNCNACLRACPENAMVAARTRPEEALECDACPIKCWILPGAIGACRRYVHQDGKISRTTMLHTFEDVCETVGMEPKEEIRQPLITGIGSGTTYPCCKPAPQIVSGRKGDVDVVTVVTEVPLSYSSVIVKVDTDLTIGEEGAPILIGKRQVGMVETEQYGSKMLHIGGVNRLTGSNGFAVARAVTDIANRKPVKLKIENGSRLTVQVGKPPVIDGKEVAKMRVGCGSATLGIFAPLLKEVADEAIILDSHVTGLMSEHVAGTYAGVKPTGVQLKFLRSTPGRYFGDHGEGWGGTSITDPADIIKSVDMTIGWEKMTILVTETTGQNGALYEVDEKGNLLPVALTEKAKEVLNTIESSCEPSMVSAIYTAGSGGSARAGVTKFPIKLTQAVHQRKANLTVAGSPTFVMPGGGISFMVDVQRVKPGSFYWTPTPATICPVEYTMEKDEYERMGGHVGAMKPFKVPGDSE